MSVDVLAGISAFKTLYDSAKALKDINDAAVRNGAVVELGEKILAAQAAQMALLQRVSDLEKQVADFKTWEADKQRYELIALAPNVVAYAPKESMRGGEPPHLLCANCYNSGMKKFMQPVHNGPAHFQYRCSSCNQELTFQKSRGVPSSARRDRGGPDDWMGN